MLYKHWRLVYAATLTLPWMASQSGPGPRALDTNLSLSLLVLPPACHLCQGLCPPSPHPPEAGASRNKGNGTGAVQTIFQLPWGTGVEATESQRGCWREEVLPLTLARSSCGCSLRVKRKVRACEGRKQPRESPRLAWGKEDEPAAPGRPARGGS